MFCSEKSNLIKMIFKYLALQKSWRTVSQIVAWMNTYNLKEPTGNYFDDSIKEGEVAFAKLLPEEERSGLGKTLVRSWTVGEILTAIGNMGLFIRTFEEIPSSTDPRFPEFYTLIADKIDIELSPIHP